MNELILIGTGFVLARVLFIWYRTPAAARKNGGDGSIDGR
jgi:hypothetical protein